MFQFLGGPIWTGNLDSQLGEPIWRANLEGQFGEPIWRANLDWVRFNLDR